MIWPEGGWHAGKMRLVGIATKREQKMDRKMKQAKICQGEKELAAASPWL